MKFHGSSRVGSGRARRFHNLTARVESWHPYPIRPDPTRPMNNTIYSPLPPFQPGAVYYPPWSASQTVFGRMQLTVSCNPPYISRRFALGANNVCLFGDKPDVLRLRRCRGARAHGYTTTARHDMSTAPPPIPLPGSGSTGCAPFCL